ncbi:hypothetical protein HOG21_04945 [bacterium]|nr:hypothetical protein [bacterium]
MNAHIVNCINHTSSAIIAAYIAYHVGQSIANPSSDVAVSNDTIATGQVANCLELHHNAAIITGRNDAYSP